MGIEKIDSSEMDNILKQATEAKQKAQSAGMSVDDNLTTSQSYETFLELKGFPSRGLFYKQQINGQALRVEDILLLSNIDEDNVYDKFNQLFLRRIKGVLPREIAMCDEMFFAFWLREAAFPQIGFPGHGHTCMHCKTENPPDAVDFYMKDITFNIKDFDEIVARYKEGNGKYIVKVPQSGKEFRINLLRRGHIDKIKSTIQDVFSGKITDDMLKLVEIAININTDVNIMDTIEEIKTLSPTDFIHLLKEKNKSTLVTEPIISMPCAKCKEATPIHGYPFLLAKYIPIDQL